MANPSYDADARLAEFYDSVEVHQKDVALIRWLIEGRSRLRILEPFCGTGRILIPLAQDGHEIVGLDVSEKMLDRAAAKLGQMPAKMQARVQLIRHDCVHDDWPLGFDVVLLAGNCLYELATAQQQEHCIRMAAGALSAGGFLYLDNDHMEGDLAESWCVPGVEPRYPNGMLADGTKLRGTSELIWHDRINRMCRWKRRLAITFRDGREQTCEWIQQKHPPSIAEMRHWLMEAGFSIEGSFGDYAGSTLSECSPRAIFWCCKKSQHEVAQ